MLYKKVSIGNISPFIATQTGGTNACRLFRFGIPNQLPIGKIALSIGNYTHAARCNSSVNYKFHTISAASSNRTGYKKAKNYAFMGVKYTPRTH